MSARKARIPFGVRLRGAVRRWGRSMVNDLREHMERKSGSAAPSDRRKGPGKGKPKANAWPMCAECFHRVPWVCPTCEKAKPGVTKSHPAACCQCKGTVDPPNGVPYSREPYEPEELPEDETTGEDSEQSTDQGEAGPDTQAPGGEPAPAAPAPTPQPSTPAPAAGNGGNQ